MNKRIHVKITGDVTGVGYRYWTKIQAEKLELTGWVRNRDEGYVEAVFEGPKDILLQMIDKCHEGPEISWVENVEVEWKDATGENNNFTIR